MDLNQEIKSFTPIDIEKYSQNQNVSEQMIDSVKAYNKALEYLRTGSEDIAMIELKRVVAINPNLGQAVNLLGLCYAYTNQLDKAEALFNKVVEGESNVLRAADYLNFISAGDNGMPKRNIKQNKSVTTNKVKASENKKEAVNKKSYSNDEVKPEYLLFKKFGSLVGQKPVALIFNIVSVICLVAALILFFSSSKGADKASAAEPKANTTINDNMNGESDDVNQLKKQLAEANLKLKQIQMSDQINQASTLYNQKKYVEAADKLSAIPVHDLSADQKKRYDSLKTSVIEKAANQLTTEGNTLYNRRNYAEAIVKLEKVFALGDNWSFGDKALYILGKSYVEIGDKQKGAEAYQKLINQYPKSSYVKFAKPRLTALQ